MTLKIILSERYFRQYYITKKIDLHGSDCGLRIRIRFLTDPDPGDKKIPDLTSSAIPMRNQILPGNDIVVRPYLL